MADHAGTAAMKWSKKDDDALRKALPEFPTMAAASASLRRSTDACRNRAARLGIAATVGTACEPATVEDAARFTAAELKATGLTEQVRELTIGKKRLLAELADARKQAGLVQHMRDLPPLQLRDPARGVSKVRHGIPVAVLSDLHVEEPVNPDTVNGLNRYNLEIADQVIRDFGDGFIWLNRDKRFDVRQAVLAILGDLFSGYIHDELVENNFLSPTQAVEWLLPRLEAMIHNVLAQCRIDKLTIVCTDGNHGRLTHQIRVSTRTANSLEHLMYKVLAARFANEERVEFRIAEGEWEFLDINGLSVGFTHGDTFRSMGGVGGVLVPLRRGFNEMKKYRKLDVMICGHFHQRIDEGEILVNGSGIGVNPYSMHIHAKPEVRQQSWFMVDAERGKCLSTPIWLPR